MAVEQLSSQPAATQVRSEIRFPAYTLLDSVEVPKVIHVQGGGACSVEHLATYLGYKGTNNGAFVAKLGAARGFGLIAKSGNLYVPTQLAHQILSPTYPHEAKLGLVEAFFNVPLFKRIHDDFKGRELPPEFGLKNAMRTQYGILSSRADLAYRVLMESAETAGFFSTRNGAKTHLITPQIHASQVSQTHMPAVEEPNPAHGGGSGGDGGPPDLGQFNGIPGAGTFGGTRPNQLTEVKAKYLSTLITLFEEKSKKGELDEKLMERIERLLGEIPTGGTS